MCTETPDSCIPEKLEIRKLIKTLELTLWKKSNLCVTFDKYTAEVIKLLREMCTDVYYVYNVILGQFFCLVSK